MDQWMVRKKKKVVVRGGKKVRDWKNWECLTGREKEQHKEATEERGVAGEQHLSCSRQREGRCPGLPFAG